MSCKTSEMNTVVAVFLALTVSVQQVGPVWAGPISVQTQVEYDLTQTKYTGLSAISDGRFSNNYNLLLRRPFLPTSSLITELSVNTTENGDANTTQSTRNWTLNMYANQPKYMLVGRIIRSDYGTSSDSAGSSTGLSTDYNAGLFLREPAYPVVNIQFLRNVASTSYAGTVGSYSATTWLMSSYYDLAPFRFSYDRTRQLFGYSGSPGVQQTNQTSAIKLDHTLMTGLVLSGELSKTITDVAYSSGTSATNTNRRIVRLTATPTRSIVADVDFTSQSNGQDLGGFNRTNNNNSISWDVRSEIFPGLSVDYVDQKQSQTGSAFIGTGGSTSRNRNLSLAARLSDASALSITATRTGTDIASTASGTQQDSLQTALQTSITRTTDFSLNYGRSKSTVGQGDSFNSSFVSASIRDRTSPTLSMGATYRRTNVHSQVLVGSPFDQFGDAVDMDMLWQPNYDIGINLRLSYQNNTGTSANRILSPSANLRWQLDSSTSLTTNYTLQRFRQFDPTVALSGQNTNGLSIRMTHNFMNGSYLDLSYDFQGINVADLEWRKQLRVLFTFNL